MTTSESPMPPTFSPLPEAPRPLTARARLRSWAESPVRMWLIFGVAFFVAFVVLTWVSARETMRLRWLIDRGQPVTGKVTMIGLNKDRSASRDEAVLVAMEIQLPGRKNTDGVSGNLSRKTGGKVSLGDMVPLRVNPDDLSQWTDLTEAPPWAVQFTGAYMVLPIWLLGCLGAVWRRSQILATYRDGQQQIATVVGTRKPASAPGSQMIRFTLDEGDDDRVYQCFWPTRLGKLAVDDAIELIVPANPTLAVPAKAYV